MTIGSAPRVSVLMPAYNAARTIRRACASLIAQTFEDWECVVVDDGSHDETAELVEQIHDTRFRVIRLQENVGRGAARQIALENSRGKFVAFLDADDWWYPAKLKRQLHVMEVVGSDIVSTGMAIISPSEELKGVSVRDDRAAPVIMKEWRRLGRAPVAFGPSLVKGELARSCRFDPRLRRSQDYDFLIQACFRRGACAVIQEVLYAYERGASNAPAIVLQAYKYSRKAHWKNFFRDPVGAGAGLALSYMKSVVVWGLSKIGGAHALAERRYQRPSERQSAEYAAALRTVKRVMEGLPR